MPPIGRHRVPARLTTLVPAAYDRRLEHDMVLTDEQRRRFREDGYVAVPGFFDADELATLRGELARLRAEGRLRNVTTTGDGATPATSRANLQVCPISPLNPTIRALHHAPRVVAAVGELVGHPVRFVLDQIFCKPARDGA